MWKSLGVTVTNTNGIREEIKCRINMGNASYYSPENNYRPVVCETILLPVVLYGCETRSLT